jgi:hypothetical protein
MPLLIAAKKKRDFDPKKFLAIIGEGRKVVAFSQKQQSSRRVMRDLPTKTNLGQTAEIPAVASDAV